MGVCQSTDDTILGADALKVDKKGNVTSLQNKGIT